MIGRIKLMSLENCLIYNMKNFVDGEEAVGVIWID
jgi:hypothetical protein